MISVYTGTPGSGKSYHATEKIELCLRCGINVIANYKIKTNHRHKAIFRFLRTSDFSVDYFIKFAKEHHKPNKESQSLIVVDEAHVLFNSRGFDMKERLKWIDFLSWSRHLGYDIILITQNDRAIDRQVRGLIEYNHKHRKLSSFGAKGMLLVVLFRKKFICVRYWYVIDEKADSFFFNIKKKVASLYDTFASFTEDSDSDDSVQAVSELPNVSTFNKERGVI